MCVFIAFTLVCCVVACSCANERLEEAFQQREHEQAVDARRGMLDDLAALGVRVENKKIVLQGGEFLMGEKKEKSPYPADNEWPVRTVHVNAFALDEHEVSNAEFLEFVLQSEYKTEAESFGNSFVFEGMLTQQQQESVDNVVAQAPW
jgi:sulfatase modifying factor 1